MSRDGREPFSYDYTRVSSTSPWKVMPGRYTREGDVLPLLLGGVDDMFVVARPGDEAAVSFDASQLPTLPPGWARTFLIHADGFSKEMDLTGSPYQVPRSRSTHETIQARTDYPNAAHRDYVERTTRATSPRAAVRMARLENGKVKGESKVRKPIAVVRRVKRRQNVAPGDRWGQHIKESKPRGAKEALMTSARHRRCLSPSGLHVFFPTYPRLRPTTFAAAPRLIVACDSAVSLCLSSARLRFIFDLVVECLPNPGRARSIE